MLIFHRQNTMKGDLRLFWKQSEDPNRVSHLQSSTLSFLFAMILHFVQSLRHDSIAPLVYYLPKISFEIALMQINQIELINGRRSPPPK